MKKDQVFWVVWAVVVAAAGAVQFLVVGDMRRENREILARGRYLAARFNNIDPPITKGIQAHSAKTPAEKKKYGKPDEAHRPYVDPVFDGKLYSLYPLVQNHKLLPGSRRMADEKELTQNLAKARSAFVKEQFPKFSLRVDPAADFKPPAPATTEFIPFRFWVRDQDVDTDRAFARAAGKNIEMTMLEARLDKQGVPLEWMPDGKVTGWIRDKDGTTVPEEREKVFKRLLLRRELLLAMARVQAPVEGLVRVGEDKPGAEVVEKVGQQSRGVDRIISLKFVDAPPGTKPAKAAYTAHGVEIEVSCHLGVVTALLRELETAGLNRKDRPYAFWVEKLVIRRAAGWPGAVEVAGEVKSDAGNGRYSEWPVVVRIAGAIPEFTDKHDPEPQ